MIRSVALLALCAIYVDAILIESTGSSAGDAVISSDGATCFEGGPDDSFTVDLESASYIEKVQLLRTNERPATSINGVRIDVCYEGSCVPCGANGQVQNERWAGKYSDENCTSEETGESPIGDQVKVTGNGVDPLVICHVRVVGYYYEVPEELQEIGADWYYSDKKKKNKAARKICQEKGMYLWTPSSIAEAVTYNKYGYSSIWTGVTDAASEGTFVDESGFNIDDADWAENLRELSAKNKKKLNKKEKKRDCIQVYFDGDAGDQVSCRNKKCDNKKANFICAPLP